MKGTAKGCEMQRYGKEAFEAIISRHGCLDLVDVRADGVWPSETCKVGDPTQRLLWVPACELEGPDAPDPLVAPGLPIPFTASELAAFTLDGIGTMVTELYGPTADGPYAEMLDALGPRGTKAKEAVRAAYEAIRNAEGVAGKLDRAFEMQAGQLAEEYEQQNLAANTREGVFAQGIAREEAQARRARAAASVEELKARCRRVHEQQELAFSGWRKAMVNHLLRAPKSVDERVGGSNGMLLVKLERDDCVNGAFVKIGCVAGAIARANGSHNPRDAERKIFARVNAGVQLKLLNPLDPEHLTPLSREDYGMGVVPFAELDAWGRSTKLFAFTSEFISADVTPKASQTSLRREVLDMVHRRSLGLIAPPVAQGADAIPAEAPRADAIGPKYSMRRQALIQAHVHEWPTIDRDMKDASTNGLAAAKAGRRDWNEAAAMEWAKAKGKLKNVATPANVLAQGVSDMVNLPSRKHVLKG